MPDHPAPAKKVPMKVLQYHTYEGAEYHEGDTYDADEQFVETLEALKFAQRADTAAPDAPHARAHGAHPRAKP